MSLIDELKKLTHPYEDEDEEFEDFEEPARSSREAQNNVTVKSQKKKKKGGLLGRLVRRFFLLLFTLVENSIKHAMTLYEPLGITVTCQRVEEENFTGIRLTEEDTGSGFTREALDKLFENNPDSLFVKEHLGLTNVRYTLKLIYHRNDLLRISNRECGGAHIEIYIPDQEENQ